MKLDPNTLELILQRAVQEALKAAASAPIVSEYLTTQQAAVYLGLSRQSLEIWRCRQQGPKYYKLAQAVRYKKSDLDEYMAAHATCAKEGSHDL